MHWVVWTEEEAGIWNFRGKAGDSRVEEKEQTCGKQILSGVTKSNGAQRALRPAHFARFLLVGHVCSFFKNLFIYF